MPRYVITATVAVDVEIEIEADEPSLARSIFSEHIVMTASLLDVPAEKYDVGEDSISDVTDIRISKAAA